MVHCPYVTRVHARRAQILYLPDGDGPPLGRRPALSPRHVTTSGSLRAGAQPTSTRGPDDRQPAPPCCAPPPALRTAHRPHRGRRPRRQCRERALLIRLRPPP